MQQGDHIYAKVKKKKESTHKSILSGEGDPNNRPEDFWHIEATQIPENEGSITNLTGSSMRLHRDVPLVKILREDERKSASGNSDVAITEGESSEVVNTDTGVVIHETERPKSGTELTADVNEASVKDDDSQVVDVTSEENKDRTHQNESARASVISDRASVISDRASVISDGASVISDRSNLAMTSSEKKPNVVHGEILEEHNQESDLPEDEGEVQKRPEPGPLQIPGLKISEGKTFMTPEDIKAESINPGSFASLQASWKMREAQIQSGLNAPMLTPTVGLNYADEDFAPVKATPPPPVVREQPVLTQKYTNEDEGRMFSFESSKGKLASVWESDTVKTRKKDAEAEDDTITKNAKVGSFASGAGVAAVDQIYMDPQEIRDNKSNSDPVFTVPPPPTLPEDEGDSGDEMEEVEKDDNRFSFGADSESINSNSQTNKTSRSELGNRSVVSDKESSQISNENVRKEKHLRFNEEIELIQRISIAGDDVSEISSVVNNTQNGDDNDDDDDDDDDDGDDDDDADDDADDDDDDDNADGDDEQSEDDEGNVTAQRRSSLHDRPPTPLFERKTTHM